MRFNQINQNNGDVNNAFSEKGNVIQTTGWSRVGEVTAAAVENGTVVQTGGESNRVQVAPPQKASFWSELRKKLSSLWRWIKGLFSGWA